MLIMRNTEINYSKRDSSMIRGEQMQREEGSGMAANYDD